MGHNRKILPRTVVDPSKPLSQLGSTMDEPSSYELMNGGLLLHGAVFWVQILDKGRSGGPTAHSRDRSGRKLHHTATHGEYTLGVELVIGHSRTSALSWWTIQGHKTDTMINWHRALEEQNGVLSMMVEVARTKRDMNGRIWTVGRVGYLLTF